MDRTIIIAEIGECFNGDLPTGRKLILEAKKSGCDIVKFQTLDYENISPTDPEREWFEKIALSSQKIHLLIRYAKKTGIQILFTPENKKTATWLLDAGLIDVKIASSTVTDKDLLKFVNRRFRRVFISTGMASLDEVKTAVRHLSNVKELYIMHCVSEYPTGPLLERYGLKALSLQDARLNMMKILKETFPQHKVGYSDHTSGILAPIVAVAIGAEVIEKHITLDRKIPMINYYQKKKYMGTDHILSLEPGELKEMVTTIRLVEQIIGEKEWKRSKGELLLKNFLRKRFTHERKKVCY